MPPPAPPRSTSSASGAEFVHALSLKTQTLSLPVGSGCASLASDSLIATVPASSGSVMCLPHILWPAEADGDQVAAPGAVERHVGLARAVARQVDGRAVLIALGDDAAEALGRRAERAVAERLGIAQMSVVDVDDVGEVVERVAGGQVLRRDGICDVAGSAAAAGLAPPAPSACSTANTTSAESSSNQPRRGASSVAADAAWRWDRLASDMCSLLLHPTDGCRSDSLRTGRRDASFVSGMSLAVIDSSSGHTAEDVRSPLATQRE